MYRPTQTAFEQLASRGRLIPVVREIRADMDTALSLFKRLDDGLTSFLFESVEGAEKWARHSFIGTGARAIFRARGQDVEWTESGETQRIRVDGDPLAYLRDKISSMAAVVPDEVGTLLPPFLGGAVGFVGYDWVRFVEQLPDTNPDPIGLPDLWFVFPETVVIHDNASHTAFVARHSELLAGDDVATAYRRALEEIDEVVRKLREPMPGQSEAEPLLQPMDVARSATREEYHGIVKRAKEYIEAGDIFQVVLSQQFRVPLQVDPFTIYRQLRSINPSPYLFYMQCEGPVIVGSSPEALVRLVDGAIDVRPIAGTRKRGDTLDEDAGIEKGLLEDEKERAEHLMLVDLGRNDVGRVAEVGSVRVSEFMKIERYSHLMHIVSNVQGKLRDGLDWLDLLRATFPAGTLSGAPKVRAMEIIDELENLRRGIYGGCVGYIDYSGNIDTAIAIRTMLIQDGEIFMRTGAGIVADSDPDYEFEETVTKVRALVAAIDMAREGID
ncbi:MAG: anthranilate synthase component I [Myxococcota bacterium]